MWNKAGYRGIPLKQTISSDSRFCYSSGICLLSSRCSIETSLVNLVDHTIEYKQTNTVYMLEILTLFSPATTIPEFIMSMWKEDATLKKLHVHPNISSSNCPNKNKKDYQICQKAHNRKSFYINNMKMTFFFVSDSYYLKSVIVIKNFYKNKYIN